jgi:hypothetical protein
LHEQGFAVSVISPKGRGCDRESYIRLRDIHIYRYHAPTHAKTRWHICGSMG